MDEDIERAVEAARALPAPRLLTHAIRDVAAALVDQERANGTGLTQHLRDSYGDALVEQELTRLRDVLSA